MSTRPKMRRETAPQLRPDFWELPVGWCWQITRVIRCLPCESFEGFRVTLFHTPVPVIEVEHEDVNHARFLAVSEAAEMYPGTFKGWES